MSIIAPSPRPGMGAIPYRGGTTFRVWAPHAASVFVTGTFDDWAGDRMELRPDGNGTSGVWSADVEERRARRRIPFPDPQQRRRSVAHRPVRAPYDQLGRQRHRLRPGRLRLGRRRLPGPDVGRPGHLRDACRDLLGIGGPSRHVRRGAAEAPLPGSSRGVRRAGHAPVRVRRRHLLGLQPGAPVRDRVRLRRAGRVQAVHPRCPCARHRRDRGRRLQPPRPVRPRSVAVRRLVRGRRRRDLLLQRRPRRHAMGPHPAGLRTRRGPLVPAGQRADVARGVPLRRAPVRRDGPHPDGGRRPGRPVRRPAGRLVVHGLDQRRDPGSSALEDHDRRGPAG